MFELKVIEKRVEGGINISINDNYTTSPGVIIFIQNRDYLNEGTANYLIHPKVYFEFIAKSTKELLGIIYRIKKYNESKYQYELAGYGYKLGVHNVGGKLVWDKKIQFDEYKGSPIKIDLTDTNFACPLKLEVEAIQRNGLSKIIKSRYFELLGDLHF